MWTPFGSCNELRCCLTLEFTCAGFVPDVSIKGYFWPTEVDRKPRLGVKCNDLLDRSSGDQPQTGLTTLSACTPHRTKPLYDGGGTVTKNQAADSARQRCSLCVH